MTAAATSETRRWGYTHLDVFTSHRFEGNQLAVFLDARGISDRLMQRIAREMNFSETTFVLPADAAGTDARMRIFTPGVELPIAGHPTVGTAFALAHAGVIPPGRPDFTFGLNVGPTRVELTWDSGLLAAATMDQPSPDVRDPLASAAEIARSIGVDVAAHESTGWPVKEISCGVPYILLPLATRAAVDAATPDMAALARIRSAFGTQHTGVYVFSTEPGLDEATAYSRMFSSGLGLAEDPATGSACGPLGAYLVAAHGGSGAPHRGDVVRMVCLQGVAMGRPSRIHIAITVDGQGAITRVQVGGQAVVVAEGTLTTGGD